MSLTHTPDGDPKGWYEVASRVLAIITIFAAFSAVGWSWQNERANDRQDRERITDAETFATQNAELLACVDTYVSELSSGLPPVRKASAARDDRLVVAAATLRDALVKTIDGSITEAGVQAVVESINAYLIASETLDDVREANPYPSPPSTACAKP